MAKFVKIDNQTWINSDKVILFQMVRTWSGMHGRMVNQFTFYHEDLKTYQVQVPDENEANSLIRTLEGNTNDENNQQA